MSLYEGYLWTQVACSAILLIIYLAVFIKVLHGSVYIFVLKLTVMLFLSNVATLFLTFANFANLESLSGGSTHNLYFWYWVEGIAAIIGDSTFGLAHWLFAFEYYRICKIMPLAIQGISAKTLRTDTILYWSLFILNILVPIVEGVLVIRLNFKEHNSA